MSNIKLVEKFLLTEVAAELGRKSLDPEEDLLERNVIDSLGILKLVSFLEETCKVEVNEEDIIPENFQTLRAIERFLEEKSPDSPRSRQRMQRSRQSQPAMPLRQE